jgi:hypothetical protein
MNTKSLQRQSSPKQEMCIWVAAIILNNLAKNAETSKPCEAALCRENAEIRSSGLSHAHQSFHRSPQ